MLEQKHLDEIADGVFNGYRAGSEAFDQMSFEEVCDWVAQDLEYIKPNEHLEQWQYNRIKEQVDFLEWRLSYA